MTFLQVLVWVLDNIGTVACVLLIIGAIGVMIHAARQMPDYPDSPDDYGC